jgi:hypothetical protein
MIYDWIEYDVLHPAIAAIGAQRATSPHGL